MQKQKDIQNIEKNAKDKLLFIQLSAAKTKGFSLTESTIKFIEEYGLNIADKGSVSNVEQTSSV
jgi:hypothetical protein